MKDGFFERHPQLGSRFDYNRDGDMSAAELGGMAGFLHMYADEHLRAARDAEAELEDDERSSYSKHGKKSGKKHKKKSSYDDLYHDSDLDIYDVDASDNYEVMDAVMSGKYYEDDLEYLVQEALDNGVRFDEDDIEIIADRIDNDDLIEELRDTL